MKKETITNLKLAAGFELTIVGLLIVTIVSYTSEGINEGLNSCTWWVFPLWMIVACPSAFACMILTSRCIAPGEHSEKDNETELKG